MTTATRGPKLYALSDLHVGHPTNAAALATVREHPEDWVILAGDLGETLGHLDKVLDVFVPRFARVLWVPGNHELWTLGAQDLRGEEKYLRLVDRCRARGVLTPEDPFPRWPGAGPERVLVPMFLLYDYSFCPPSVGADGAVRWAAEASIVCRDEYDLHSDPYPSRARWCEARVESTEARLRALPEGARTVLINHFPLRYDTVYLPRIPRFSPWCGTRRTEDWHLRYRAEVVVSGHLHVRTTVFRDGVRFEEVSLGNPRQWNPSRAMDTYLREILAG